MRKFFMITMLVCWLGLLGAQGAQAAYIDNGDTVIDTLSGLEWQKATAGPLNWRDALAYCENLTLAGKSDWRLPDKKELWSLTDFSHCDPAIAPVFTATTQSDYYWSSTTYQVEGNLHAAWLANFTYGFFNGGYKSDSYYVRAVRGRQSGPLVFLTISKSGNGVGTVTSTPAGIDCGSNCTGSYTTNSTVSLTATADTGSTFTGWSGDCTGTASPLDVLINGKACTATFTLNNYTVSFNSNGGSSVASQSVAYNVTATVPTAPTKTGNTFADWYSDAGLVTSFVFTTPITGATTLYAKWTANNYELTVSKVGTGTVTGGGTYDYGTTKPVTAAAATGSTFTGWSGDCTGTTSPLAVLMDSNKTCTATFTLNTHTLTVNKGGTGTGSVTGGGTYNYGTTKQVTATASIGSTFTGWSGDCTGTTSPLDVLMSSNKTCTATFGLNQQTLTVNTAGTGTGTTSGGGTYDYGTTKQVTATAATGSTFTGWSGDCSGPTSPLAVLMNGNKNCTATFTLNQQTSILPPGENVVVTPVPEVQITFPSITTAGSVTVTAQANPSPPSNFRVLTGSSYQIVATGGFTFPVTVCMDYSDSALADSRNEDRIRLYHNNGTAWEDITTPPVDTVNNRVCGLTYSLSPFILVEPTTIASATKVPVQNGLWLIPSVLTGLYLLRRRKKPSA